MLVSLQTVLKIAEEKKCAIPAFNVYNAETALGAIFAAEEANSCVILQMYSRLFSNFEAGFMAPLHSGSGPECQGEGGLPSGSRCG